MLVVLLLCAGWPSVTRAADGQAFVWDDITVTVALRPDASIHVSERNRIHFIGGPFRQGYREIPLARIEDISNIRVRESTAESPQPYRYVSPGSFSPTRPNTFTYQRVGTNVRIQWSFPPTTNDFRTFLLDYDVYGALRVYDDAQPPYQQISWAGVDRELTNDARVNRATLIIMLPRPADPRTTVAEGSGTLGTSGDGLIWFWKATGLGRGESLEGTLQFAPLVAASKPAWQDASDRREVLNAQLNLVLLGLALLTIIGGGLLVLIVWWARGRDPDVAPMPEFVTTPPGPVPPGVVGALLDERVDKRDIVATLIDLGQRGVLRIDDHGGSGRRRTGGVVLTLLDPDAPLASFEQALVEVFFGRPALRNAQMALPTQGNKRFLEAIEHVERLLANEVVSRGYFELRPARTRAAWRIGGAALIALGVGGFFVSSGFTGMFLVLVAAVLGLGAIVYSVARFMPRKTQAGAEAAAQWRAFKRYMEAIHGFNESEHADGIFAQYLPYAIAFGIERSWVTAFSSTPAATPHWYRGFHLGGGFGSGTGSPASPAINPAAGVQGISNRAATSLQSTSASLLGLFDTASQSFAPSATAIGGSSFRGASLGLRLGLVVFKAASGGGGGGFS